MTTRRRRRLYREATRFFIEAQVDGLSGRPRGIGKVEEVIKLAINAGYAEGQAARDRLKVREEDRGPIKLSKKLPVETWALILAEAQRP